MSQSDRRSRINWPSTLTEVGLILLGLLLAFSADRAWENRQDVIRESGHIARLHQDFSATAASLDTAIAHQNRVLEAGKAILEAMADPAADDAVSRFSEAIPAVFDFRSPRVYTAAYDELQSSGDFGVLRDQELRLALAEFEALLRGNMAQREDIVRDEWIHRVRPVLGSRIPSEIYLKPDHSVRRGSPESPFDTNLREVMTDLEFWNLITHRMIVASGSQGTFVRAREIAARIVDLTMP
jgi:hypothetical protein